MGWIGGIEPAASFPLLEYIKRWSNNIQVKIYRLDYINSLKDSDFHEVLET